MLHVNVLPQVESDPDLVLIVSQDGVMEASRHLENYHGLVMDDKHEDEDY